MVKTLRVSPEKKNKKKTNKDLQRTRENEENRERKRERERERERNGAKGGGCEEFRKKGVTVSVFSEKMAFMPPEMKGHDPGEHAK